ncbi:MAG: hypothetical protein EXR33_06235 [Betaproteobacteria bacterium]|nr:hypothetical protein [Betaproteobacteria bacterium]
MSSADDRHGNETLRWPTNLDHRAIVLRLVEFREAARAAGLADIAERFDRVEDMPAAQIGAMVIATMTLLQERTDQMHIARQLEMIAMNLKNLK